MEQQYRDRRDQYGRQGDGERRGQEGQYWQGQRERQQDQGEWQSRDWQRGQGQQSSSQQGSEYGYGDEWRRGHPDDWRRSQGSYYDSGSRGSGAQGEYGQGRFGGYGAYGAGGYAGTWGAPSQYGPQSQYGQVQPGRTGARRGPKGYHRSDERIKEDICERLMQREHIDAGDVTVEVKESRVTLEGQVPERRMKHEIEDIVDSVMGVQDVDNRIHVERQGGLLGSLFGKDRPEAERSESGSRMQSSGTTSGSATSRTKKDQ